MKVAPPELPGSVHVDSPLDRALALSLAGEREAALRWSAAAVEHEGSPSALVITCRLLADAGRTEAATQGFELAVKRSIDAGNLPLAVAAVADLGALGRDVNKYLDEIAATFSKGSPRITESVAPPPPLPAVTAFQPLSSFLTGPALLSKATAIIRDAENKFDALDMAGAASLVAPIPLFSELPPASLRALISTFEMISVPAGKNVISEGTEGSEAYIVARGEVQVQRSGGEGEDDITLARLGNGALFGEMALISRAPRAASVVACRPSILLVARRDALERVAEKRPDVGVELAAHCVRRMVANLVRTSRVLNAVTLEDRPALVEHFEMRFFEKGERLITRGSDSVGLYLIASGSVAVVAEEAGETLVLATLGVGDVVGEIALIFRRKSSANVVAVHPTVTLFLAREDFISLIREHPAILQSLYLLAAERDEETSLLIADSTTNVNADDFVLL